MKKITITLILVLSTGFGQNVTLDASSYDFGEVAGLSRLDTTAVIGLSWLDVEQRQDLDVSPADLLTLDEVDDYRQQTFEWRFSGAADSLFGLGGNVEFIGGLYYFQSDFRIIADIIEDFSLKPRLNNNRGTAMLVGASIYDACHYFRLFQNTSFGSYCGIITSFEPNHNAISREPANSDERYKFDTYSQYVLKNGQSTKQYEDETKRRFKEEPANCKLLIVVSKLLTGFDAPSCTYI